MNNFKNFIFDLDGTLIDSTPSHVKAFNYAISKSSQKCAVDFNYEKMKGKRTIDVMNELGFSGDEAKKLTKIKQDSYREYLMNGEVNLFESVRECFELITAKNFEVYICTGASRHSVDIILKKFDLDKYITDYITGSDVEVAKPDPAILNKLIADNKLQKELSLFVEDSENGKDCGVRAGVKTIIVNNPDLSSEGDFETFNEFYLTLKDSI